MFFYLIVISCMPRASPVPLSISRLHITKWKNDALTNKDFLRYNQLSPHKYNFKGSNNVGVVSVIVNDEYTAFALMEKIGTGMIHIWSIDSNDFSSGTALVGALAKNKKITFSYALNDRWKIALSYFR